MYRNNTETPSPIPNSNGDFILRPRTLKDDDNDFEDLHRTNKRISTVTAESVGKTRELLGLMHECQDAGVNTLYMLYSQGEQLKKIDKTLDETGHEIKQASTTVENMKKKERASLCCLPYVLCCTRDPEKRRTESNRRDSQEVVKVYENKLVEEQGEVINPTNTRMPDSGDEPRKSATNEEKLANNLGNISRHVSTLKIIATDMGNETDRHNERVDTMNLKVEKSVINLGSVTRNVNNITSDDGADADRRIRNIENESIKHFRCCSC
ncbi:unnamed protein product [Orchesella dallaii]|uniref:t-SNARE coiled-coil homology domain-containing protein n=1 Tax=Orchesella dallaii TaxID=48710 RepID=A0ABP1R0S5_9HEXA